MSRILFFIASVVICGGLLLWVGGDLRFKKAAPAAPRLEELPKDLERQETGANVMLQQKLTNWTFKGFNRDVGQYDLLASGREVVPVREKSAKGTESYLAKDLKITIFSFRRDSGQVRRSSTTDISAPAGTISLDENQRLVNATFPGAATLESSPEEGSRAKPILVQTSDVTVTGLQPSAEKDAGTKLKIEAKGKTRIKIGNSDLYGSGFTANTLEKRLILANPVEMYVSPEQLEPLFETESKKVTKQIFKVTADGEVSISDKPVAGAQALIDVRRNVVLTDGTSRLLCENLSLVIGSDQKLSELCAEGRVRLEKGGVICIGQSLIYKAAEKTISLTGAPDITITDGTNEIFCNRAQLKEDSSYAKMEGNVKARYKTTLPAKGKTQPREEVVTLLCETAEVWFSKDEESKKMRAERAVALGSTDKQASAEGTDFVITGATFDFRFDRLGLSGLQVSGTEDKPAELKRQDGQKVCARTISFDPQSEAAVFTDNVRASLTSGEGEEKSLWNLTADRLQVHFEKNPQTGELTPDTISAESKTRVQAKCLHREREFQFEGSALTYNKKSGIIALTQGDKKEPKPTIAEGENRLTAPVIAFYSSENRLVLNTGVEGRVSIPPPKGAKQSSEKPLFSGEWAISCDRIELLFAGKEREIAGLQAKGSVKLEKKDAACEVKCDALSYERATSTITLTGEKENPGLKQQKNSITARKIVLQTDTNLATFQENAEFISSPEAPDKPSFRLTSGTVAAKFGKGTQKVQEVYAREDVRAEVAQPDSAVTRITAREAVYQAGDNTISVRGSPCILTQPQMTVKEDEIVYDIENKVIMTKPGEKGYRWEVDPSNWRKKER